MTRRPVHRRGAFTLVELAVSMAIMVIVMLACGSAMVLGARAAESGLGEHSQTMRVLRARTAVDQIVSDLEVATTVKHDKTTIVLEVPDRDGDKAPETITYAWSGVSGEDLTRTYNGTTSVIASGVSRFALDEAFLTAITGIGGGARTSALAAGLAETDGKLVEYHMKALEWCAQYVKPTFPPGATSWSISGVAFDALREGGNTGSLTVAIHAPDLFGKPTGPALGSGKIDITTIGTKRETVKVACSASGLDPSKGVVIVISTTDPKPGSVFYYTGATDPDLKFSTTSDAGSSWSIPDSTSVLQFTLYGDASGS